jgi:hypothetical protein
MTIINLTQARIERDLRAKINGEVVIDFEPDAHAVIRNLWVKSPGAERFEEWVAYCDEDGRDMGVGRVL